MAPFRRENQPLRPLPPSADPPGLVELAAAVLAGVGGVEQQVDLARAARRFRPASAPLIRVARRAPRARAGRAPPGAAPPRSARRDRRGRRASPVLKARASAPFSLPLALAASSAARSTPIQAPRPGARARTSGATWPSGPSASRISCSRGAVPPREDAGALRRSSPAAPSSSGPLGAHCSRIPQLRPPAESAALRPRTSGRGRP